MPGITNFPNYFIPQSGKSAVREISDPTMETLRAAASGAGAKRKVSRTVKCTPNIGRISICLDGMSSVLYRAHVV